MKLNVKEPNDLKEYQQKIFSDNGADTIENYIRTLYKWYLSDMKYPFIQGIILGVPQMDFARTIPDKAALHERIKAYAMILGISEIDIKLDNGTTMVFKEEK